MNYEQKKAALAQAIRSTDDVSLNKTTSNLFRHRENKKGSLDVKNFNKVISIKNGIAEVEGMTTFDEFVRQTIKHGYIPPVTPELKTITVGGAISGVGIESSSFKFGLVHETVLEMEVLLGDGRVVKCSPKKNADLFYALPNSYGTLGYVLKATIPLVKAKKYVHLLHRRYSDAEKYFIDVKKFCSNKQWDFVDGTVFSDGEMYITLGRMVDEAPRTSNYKYMKMYYRSIQQKKEDYLTTEDYIWRWDTDWFWCSKNLGMQKPALRVFVPFLLNSKSYWKIMHLNGKYKILDTVKKILRCKKRKEAVIQDVEIPIENAAKFIKFFHREIGIKPVWVCPIKPLQDGRKFTLFTMNNKLYVNFGFWDSVDTNEQPGHHNRKIELIVEKLGGKKSLYSESFYSEKDFWRLYNKKAYEQLKAKYDPASKFKNLYQKCVQKKR